MSSQLETWSTLPSSCPIQQSPKISRVYRQASSLFLTRRLPESLTTLLPVISCSPDTSDPPPIFNAPKTTRIKVWSLYLTILNSICELASDEGKQAFGTTEFRVLVSKVREGDVWDEVVKNGYQGVECDVDTDVIINLSTLLLAHGRNQKVNQSRLEAYLASKSVTDSFEENTPDHRNLIRTQNFISHNARSNTTRELNALVKILELYTLHVLLRNNEWECSREVITVSSILDEERREAFLKALQTLQDEQELIEQRRREEQRYNEEKLRRDAQEVKRHREIEKARQDEENPRKNKRGENNENDINGARLKTGIVSSTSTQSKSSTSKKISLHSGSSSTKSPAPVVKTSLSYLNRARLVIGNIYRLIEGSSRNLKWRPLSILEIMIFVLTLITLLRQHNVRNVIQRSWFKIRQTAAMAGPLKIEALCRDKVEST